MRKTIAIIMIVATMFNLGCEKEDAYKEPLETFETAIKATVTSDENLFLLAYEAVMCASAPTFNYSGDRIYCDENGIQLGNGLKLENPDLLDLMRRLEEKTGEGSWTIIVFEEEICIFMTTLKASKHDYFDCRIVCDLGNIHGTVEKDYYSKDGMYLYNSTQGEQITRGWYQLIYGLV